MNNEAEPADSASPLCPVCGGEAESVFFVDQLGFYPGIEPKGMLAQITSLFQSFARSQSDQPLIFRSPSFSAMSGLPTLVDCLHCKQCKHVILRYTDEVAP